MSQPADWGVEFRELAAEAGQASARSLSRYHELLDRVARGELDPDRIQKAFQEYLQEHATTSTQHLVELGVSLLAGLLYVEAKYHDTLLDGLLPADGPIPPPPSPSNLDLVNWFQALSAYATEQSARGVARHQALVERVAAGEISSAQVQEQGRRFLAAHAPAFLGEVMALGLGFVGGLQRSSASLTDGLYDRVLGSENARPAAPEPPICVDLRGPTGSVRAASIVVENTRAEAADVVCLVSEFAPRAGGRRFLSNLEIAPARFVLAAGEPRDISLRLTLDPALFAPGVDYVATLQISGAGDREMIVPILARADLPKAADSVRDPGPAGATAGRRRRGASSKPRRKSR